MTEQTPVAAEEPCLREQREGAWLTLWFNQPERRNPLSEALTEALLQALENAATNNEVRGITLRGAGGYFCAGGDLAGFQRLAAADKDTVIALSERAAALFAAIDRFPKPTIALVAGAAMAGGLGMLCCCDVVIGTSTAKFALTETRIGITPAQIARYVVARLGPARARQLLVTGARFDGVQAHAWGLLDAIAADEPGCEALERSIRADVLACAPGAIAATKVLLRQLPETASDAIPRVAAENFAAAFCSDEGREGIASFMERRKPYWLLES